VVGGTPKERKENPLPERFVVMMMLESDKHRVDFGELLWVIYLQYPSLLVPVICVEDAEVRRQLGDIKAKRKLRRLDRRLLAVASQLGRIAKPKK
jgi:hypothetical protein